MQRLVEFSKFNTVDRSPGVQTSQRTTLAGIIILMELRSNLIAEEIRVATDGDPHLVTVTLAAGTHYEILRQFAALQSESILVPCSLINVADRFYIAVTRALENSTTTSGSTF